jgi:hypothetical protein
MMVPREERSMNTAACDSTALKGINHTAGGAKACQSGVVSDCMTCSASMTALCWVALADMCGGRAC